MNNCANIEIQEMLPDVLHGTLARAERERVDGHLAGCESCREELRVLTTINAAAVFAPQIDANRVAEQIPPYGRIEPEFERPVRPRFVSWLVAASVAVVVAAGGSVLMTRGPSQTTEPRVVVTAPEPPPTARVPNVDAAVRVPAVSVPNTDGEHSLALAADVGGLSDGSLVQLMSDMTSFDGLPASDPEPMLTVDIADVAGQD